jgi:hypothetical protein
MKYSRQLDPIALAYSGQYGGASLPYFVGKQYGSGWLQNLARIAFPLLKKALGFAGTVAANTAEDIIESRKSFKDSIIDNTINEAQRVIAGGVKRGSGRPLSSINKASNFKRQRTIFSKNSL